MSQIVPFRLGDRYVLHSEIACLSLIDYKVQNNNTSSLSNDSSDALKEFSDFIVGRVDWCVFMSL